MSPAAAVPVLACSCRFVSVLVRVMSYLAANINVKSFPPDLRPSIYGRCALIKYCALLCVSRASCWPAYSFYMVLCLCLCSVPLLYFLSALFFITWYLCIFFFDLFCSLNIIPFFALSLFLFPDMGLPLDSTLHNGPLCPRVCSWGREVGSADHPVVPLSLFYLIYL